MVSLSMKMINFEIVLTNRVSSSDIGELGRFSTVQQVKLGEPIDEPVV